MDTTSSSSRTTQTILLLVIACVLVFVAVLAFSSTRQIDRFVGDVPSYWNYSLNLGDYSIYHLPVYPILLLPLTWILPADVHPIVVMTPLVALTWVAGVVAAYGVLRELKTTLPAVGAFLFGVYPIVGLTYTLYATSDVVARLWLMLALLFYLKGRKWSVVLMLALTLLTHKVMWVSVLIFAIVALYQRRLTILHLVLAGVPLLIYTLLGAMHHGSLSWILTGTLEHTRIETHVRTIFPIFDTILGRFANGGITNIMVGGIVLVLVLVVLVLLATRAWKGQPILLSTIVPPLVVSAFMAAASSMVVIRFSPFLIIPIWYTAFANNDSRFRFLAHPLVLVLIVGGGVVSQFVFMVHFQGYFAER